LSCNACYETLSILNRTVKCVLAGLWWRKEYKPNQKIKMAKKKYEVTMVVECEEGAQNYIADSVCDGLEDETCVTYIKVEEIKNETK